MVTTISFITACLISIILILVVRKSNADGKSKLMKYYIRIVLPIFIGILLGMMTFLFLYKTNNYNKKYLWEFMDYNNSTLIYYSQYDNEYNYEMYLTYDNNEKLLLRLNIENRSDFKSPGEYTLSIKDINGNILYYDWNKNIERGIEIRKELIDPYYSEEYLNEFENKQYEIHK